MISGGDLLSVSVHPEKDEEEGGDAGLTMSGPAAEPSGVASGYTSN